MFAVPLPQGCHCCFFLSLLLTPAAEFTASSFPSLPLLQIMQWLHVSQADKTPLPLAVVHQQRPYQVPQRGKARNHRPTVFTAHSPPCGFLPFPHCHGITLENHTLLKPACTVLQNCCPSCNSSTCWFLFPMNWTACISVESWFLSSFNPFMKLQQ